MENAIERQVGDSSIQLSEGLEAVATELHGAG